MLLSWTLAYELDALLINAAYSYFPVTTQTSENSGTKLDMVGTTQYDTYKLHPMLVIIGLSPQIG